jgi:hypothetical protein
VLLGAIPIEGIDVLIDPKRERLIVNSESPDITEDDVDVTIAQQVARLK